MPLTRMAAATVAAHAVKPPPADLGARSELLVDKHTDYIVGFSGVRPILASRLHTKAERAVDLQHEGPAGAATAIRPCCTANAGCHLLCDPGSEVQKSICSCAREQTQCPAQ